MAHAEAGGLHVLLRAGRHARGSRSADRRAAPAADERPDTVRGAYRQRPAHVQHEAGLPLGGSAGTDAASRNAPCDDASRRRSRRMERGRFDYGHAGPRAGYATGSQARGRMSRATNHDLEKVYYDTDLRAADAVVDLHKGGVPFSHIQKAFSVGVMGNKRGRHLVPTRWSITACDTIIGNNLLKEVKKCSALDTWKVHEFSSLNNRYAVILMPTPWQYEWTEAFVRVLGNEEVVFSDHELHKPKTKYSHLGGCYYSCKMAVLEALAEQQKQAGAIILREASSGYVPLGVFNVRENVRNALIQKPKEFEDVKQVKDYLSGTFTLPLRRFEEAGVLFRTLGKKRQTTLGEF